MTGNRLEQHAEHQALRTPCAKLPEEKSPEATRNFHRNPDISAAQAVLLGALAVFFILLPVLLVLRNEKRKSDRNLRK